MEVNFSRSTRGENQPFILVKKIAQRRGGVKMEEAEYGDITPITKFLMALAQVS
jgi:hypothetical protein